MGYSTRKSCLSALPMTTLRSGISALLLAIGASAANAATTTECGDTVCFSWDPDAVSLFGAPSVVGDSIIFDPTTFSASSTGEDGLVLTNATINIMIEAQDGYNLDTASLTEAGDYIMWGMGGDFATSSVSVGGQLRVRDAANTLLATDSIAASEPFDKYNPAFCMSPNNWTATAGIDLSGGDWDGVNSIVLKVENLLAAYTEPSSFPGPEGPLLAFIEKKEVGVSIGTSVIPVPAAFWLFGSGMLGMIAIARRKRA